jgi:hypothetical protein
MEVEMVRLAKQAYLRNSPPQPSPGAIIFPYFPGFFRVSAFNRSSMVPSAISETFELTRLQQKKGFRNQEMREQEPDKSYSRHMKICWLNASAESLTISREERLNWGKR